MEYQKEWVAIYKGKNGEKTTDFTSAPQPTEEAARRRLDEIVSAQMEFGFEPTETKVELQ